MITITSNAPTVTINTSGAGDSHQVGLSWLSPTGSTAPISGYNIYRAPNGSSSFAVVDSMDTQTAYTDTNVQSGQIYSYYVTTVNSSGMESPPSNITTITVP
jgi:fibronectin type 3 domain-containing protein